MGCKNSTANDAVVPSKSQDRISGSLTDRETSTRKSPDHAVSCPDDGQPVHTDSSQSQSGQLESPMMLEDYFPSDPIPESVLLELDRYEQCEEVVLPKMRRYQGDWQSGKQNGIGRMMYDDLGIYQGFWKDGYAHGFGIYTAGKASPLHGSCYRGSFRHGKAHGYGVFKFSDDSHYYGLFKADKRHGIGMECHHDDLQYIGPYVKGKKHGIGRLKSPNGEFYVGEFYENEIQGYGVYRWPDGRLYEGYWEMSVQEGPARFTWPDGRVYIGNYSNGKINGKGVLIWPDGRRYDGQWNNGLQDGTGMYFKNRTQYRTATFLEGVRTRWLSDFVTLEDEVEIPEFSPPGAFKSMNPKSVQSMYRFLLRHLQVTYQLDEMLRRIQIGGVIEPDSLIGSQGIHAQSSDEHNSIHN